MNAMFYVLIHLWLLISSAQDATSQDGAAQQQSGSNAKGGGGDRLAVATSNSISAVPLLSGTKVTSKALQMATLLQEDDYSIEVFSISFKDNLVLYGKDTIFAKPIG